MGARDRGMLDLEADTRQVPQYGKTAAPASVPGLTLVYHPRLTRIGERVKLPELTHPSTRVAVSRLKPELAPPFQPAAALPLASPFVSRRPVWIAAEFDGSFTIDVREGVSGVVVDGVAVEETHSVSAADQEIRLPLLRERRDDIGRLLIHFVERELDALGRGDELLDADAQGMSWLPAPVVARLARYAWPGNVRQLRNVARYLASVEHREVAIRVDDPQLGRLLPNAASAVPTIDASAEDIRARLAALEAERKADGGEPAPAAPKKRSPSDIGPEELERVLTAVDFKLGPAAAELGISRPALNDLVDAHPTLVRANNLTREQLIAARDRHDGPPDELWRALEVSKRGLKLRMRELDLV